MRNFLIFDRHFWQLYQTMSDSVVEAFRFKYRILNSLVRILCFPFVVNMVRVSMHLGKIIERDGHLQGVSRALMEILTQDLKIYHASVIPSSKPILFVGNHAGMGDSFSVFASSSRTDIYTLVFNNGMLRGLRSFLQFAIVIDKDNPTQALRESVRLLKQGKCVLMFPRGQIEDDPALYLESAIESLSQWSSSLEFFVKHVPDLQVIPFALGGVLSTKALNNPITKLYKVRNNRHFLAATFQLMFPYYRDPKVSIIYGDILTNESATLGKVQSQMRHLLIEIHREQMQLLVDADLTE